MISYKEALTLLHKAENTGRINMAAQSACGYVASKPVVSGVSVPPFANAAMDGFAVRSAELASASEASPVTLPVGGSTAAGEGAGYGAQDGVWEIMTGAPVPATYDAVVKIEDVVVEDRQVRFAAPVAAGENIRAVGEDFTPGDEMIKPGTLLTPYHLMALAAVGKKNIDVYRKPSVVVISTGKELVEDADVRLLPGQIRNAGGPFLISAVQEMGYECTYGGVIADEVDVFEAVLKEKMSQADIIISTGAVSEGKYDFIPEALRRLGGGIVFHKVAVRPGKPTLYARLPNGVHYFGLPGNPVSAVVGLRFFVYPLLRRVQSLSPEAEVTGTLEASASKKKGFRFFAKAHISMDAEGKLQGRIVPGQESFKVSPLLQSNGWVMLSETQEDVKQGEPVSLYPLMPDRWHFSP